MKISSEMASRTPICGRVRNGDSQGEMGKPSRRTIRSRLGMCAGLALLLGGVALWTGCTDSPTSDVDPNALVSLTSPKAGQSFKVGQTMSVQWTTKADAPDPVDNVDIQYSPTGAAPWGFCRTESIPQGTASWGNFMWTVPDSLLIGGVNVSTVSTNGRIRVMQYSTANPLMISTSGVISITAN